MTPPLKSIEIFVSSFVPSNPQLALQNTTIGSFSNPFFDLEFALIRAQEEAVLYGSGIEVNVIIRLFKGDHYMIGNRNDTRLVYYYNKYRPNGNLNYNLVI